MQTLQNAVVEGAQLRAPIATPETQFKKRPTFLCCSPEEGTEKTTLQSSMSPATALRIDPSELMHRCLALEDDALVMLVGGILRAKRSILDTVIEEFRPTAKLNEAFNKIEAKLEPKSLDAGPDPPKNKKAAVVSSEEPDSGMNRQISRESLRNASKASDSPKRLKSAQAKSFGRMKSMKVNCMTSSENLADYEGQAEWAYGLQSRLRHRDDLAHGKRPVTPIPTVQFEASVYYCKEEDQIADVGLIRIGSTDAKSVVHVETRDISAKAGVKYLPISSFVTFEPGERRKTVSIAMMNDDAWDATLEFEVSTTEKEKVNCKLGAYLYNCRCKIIDDDAFPTNRFKEEIHKFDWDAISKPVLLVEYFRMNLRNPVIKKGVVKTLLCDQFENLYFILCLFLNLYLVDGVLCEECDSSAAGRNLIFIGLLRLLPFPIIHFMNFRQVYWKVGGTSRMTIQSNLLRKYLGYDDVSLQEADESKLIMAMSRDATSLVHEAFCRLTPLISTLFRLVFLFMYQIFTPLFLGETIDTGVGLYQRIVPTVGFPIVMLVFLNFRNARTLQYLEVQKKSQNSMLHQIKHTIANFNMIRDYKKRGAYVELFVKRITHFNTTFTDSCAIMVNNQRFAKWCALLLEIAYMCYGGVQVSNDALTLGEFLNNLAVLSALGQMWGDVYSIMLEMQSTFDALTSIVEHMNMPTDNMHRLTQFQSNMRECLNLDLQDDKLIGATTTDEPCDLRCIELRELSFSYRSHGDSIAAGLANSSLVIPQGGLYTIVGPPSEGKGTVLKLLGEVLIPYFPGFERGTDGGGGQLVIPAHLRALHVSKDPLFTEGTLYSNLTMGCNTKGNDSAMPRVLAICRKLGICKDLLNTVAQNELVANWHGLLSSTEASLLHTARALIANPELLLIHKPTLCLNSEMTDTLYYILKEFVENRGLEADPSDFYNRRPRTCILTARRVAGTGSEVADAVFQCTVANGLKLLKRANHNDDNEEVDV